MSAAENSPSHSDPRQDVIARAFGADNRARLLTRYFDQSEPVTPLTAWRHVYRLLLWIDRTTALAHCYESDKAQPGRTWYARSLAFHAWVSSALGVEPARLGEHIDQLFRAAIQDLARNGLTARPSTHQNARDQRVLCQGLPEPGDDPELVKLIREVLGPWLDREPPEAKWRELTQRIYWYLTQENKRRNLVGEGFEDVIAALIARLPAARSMDSRSRCLLHHLPGFHPPPPNEKAKKVDLALIQASRRTLISAKWSIRADREEQFQSDFETYVKLESVGQDFSYVLITNEFDAARLKAACEKRRQNAPLFTRVVHINLDGVLAAYGQTQRGSATVLRVHQESGRLTNLQNWLASLETTIR